MCVSLHLVQHYELLSGCWIGNCLIVHNQAITYSTPLKGPPPHSTICYTSNWLKFLARTLNNTRWHLRQLQHWESGMQ